MLHNQINYLNLKLFCSYFAIVELGEKSYCPLQKKSLVINRTARDGTINSIAMQINLFQGMQHLIKISDNNCTRC